MTIAQQLILIETSLKPYASQVKGKVKIAADLVDFFSMILQPPGGARILVMFEEEMKRGEYEEAGFVDRIFVVGVSRGGSMKLDRGADLVQQSGTGIPLFDLIEGVRQQLRNVTFQTLMEQEQGINSTELAPDYKGAKKFEVQGYIMDAWTLRISIGCQLPAAGDVEVTS